MFSIVISDVSEVDSVLLIVVDDIVELIPGVVDPISIVVDGISLDSFEDIVDSSVDIEPVVVFR